MQTNKMRPVNIKEKKSLHELDYQQSITSSHVDFAEKGSTPGLRHKTHAIIVGSSTSHRYILLLCVVCFLSLVL